MGCYNMTGPYELTVTADPLNAGYVNLNSLSLTNLPWTGTYFGNVTTNLQAVADSGYSFVNWTSGTQNFAPNAASIQSSVNLNGTDTIVAHFLTTGLEHYDANVPTVAAYPSVFNSSTTIEFNLKESEQVSMKLYSVQGIELANIIDAGKNYPAGHHAVNLDLSKSHLSSGMYLLNFTTGDFKKSIKLIYSPN